jgi:hypothetical protein
MHVSRRQRDIFAASIMSVTALPVSSRAAASVLSGNDPQPCGLTTGRTPRYLTRINLRDMRPGRHMKMLVLLRQVAQGNTTVFYLRRQAGQCKGLEKCLCEEGRIWILSPVLNCTL